MMHARMGRRMLLTGGAAFGASMTLSLDRLIERMRERER